MTDANFWDRIAPKYAKSPISNPDAYADTLARVRTYLGATDRVVELGCGTGTTALKLAGDVAEFTGTDISEGMIAIANEKRVQRPIGGLSFKVAGVTEVPPGANVCLAFNLFHLVPDLEGAISNLYKTLPKGGLLISKTPALAGKWYVRPIIRAMQFVGKAPYVRLLSVDELDAMFEAAGFEVIETGLYPPTTPSRFIVARKN